MGSHPTAEQLAAHLGGLLTSQERAPLDAHLAGCERCRAEAKLLRGMGLGSTVAEEGLDDTHTSNPGIKMGDEIAVGDEVGRYKVIRRLGQGAMGQVFAAYDPRLDRQVAVKLLRHDVPAVENKPLRARLEREAQALARLSHPNVVAVHDLGDHGDGLFIAMDLVEGQTLSDWLRADHSWREVQRVFLEAGAGLAAAHRAGLVHRDFKPDNVLVGADGVVRVTDFGVSRRVDTGPASRNEDTITGAGSLIGTPMYMSPEQFDGASADARSDQFGFCVALFEALSGHRPYHAHSLRELRDAVHGGGARFHAETKVPRWLQALVLRGLSVKREDRFPSMDELLVALRGPRRASPVLLGTLGGAAVLALVAFALISRELERRRVDPCFQIDARAAAAWNPARQQRLVDAGSALGVVWAADALRGLTAILDGFMTGWRADYRAICAQVAATSGAERTRALGQQACLDARLETFERYRDAFDTVDARMLRDATASVSGALSQRSCTSFETSFELPPDSAQREAFTRLRSRYLTLEADSRLSRGGDLRAQFQAGREEAEALGFKGLAAAFRLLEAWAEMVRGSREAAITILEDVVVRAEVARDDTLVFHARLSLAKLLEDMDVKRARAVIPGVRAAAQRMGLDPERHGDVLAAEALLLAREGKLDRAIELQRASIAVRRPEDGAIFEAWNQLSAMQSQRGLHEESLASLEKAKTLARAAVGEQHPAYANLLLSEAALYNRAERLEESFAASEKALEIYKNDPDTRAYVIALYDYAVMLNRVGRRDQALPLVEKAVTLAEARGEVAHLATMESAYAEMLQEAGRLDDALVASTKAVSLAEQASGPQSSQLARPLAVHGALLEALKRYAEAADTLQRALELQSGPDANAVLRDITRYDLARVRWQDPRQRKAAVEEVKAVRAAFVARGERYKAYFTECDEWLAKHPPR